MRSHPKAYFPRSILLLIACVCSAALTYITVSAPLVPGDWSRLDAHKIYLPPEIHYDWTPYPIQIELWLAMVTALVAAASQASLPVPDFKARVVAKRELCLLTVLILLGFGLRLHGWNNLPLIVDEIGFAAHGSDILHGQHVPLLAPGHNGNPSLYSAAIALSMSLLGQNLFAIRLVPVIFGTLTIPAVYLFGKTWWSREIGLIGAAVVTVFPAHVFFSRMSLYNAVEPFFSLLALSYLHRAIRNRDRIGFTLAAIFAALAQYLYHGSRLTLILLGLYVLLKFRRELIRPILWMGVVLILLLLPLFASIAVHDLPLSGNSNTLRLPDDFSGNIQRAWLAWVGQPDQSPFWLSDAPLLPEIVLICFIGGIVLSLWQCRDARSMILLIAPILVTIFGGILLTAAPLYIRYITALPAMVMLTAIAIRRLPKPVQALVIILIVMQSLWLIRQHNREAVARITRSQCQADDLAWQASSLPQETSVLLVLPPDFDPVQKIMVADTIAAYGQRRVVGLSRNLPEPMVMLHPKTC